MRATARRAADPKHEPSEAEEGDASLRPYRYPTEPRHVTIRAKRRRDTLGGRDEHANQHEYERATAGGLATLSSVVGHRERWQR